MTHVRGPTKKPELAPGSPGYPKQVMRTLADAASLVTLYAGICGSGGNLAIADSKVTLKKHVEELKQALVAYEQLESSEKP